MRRNIFPATTHFKRGNNEDGAVVTQAYADEIGADGYAPDSVSAVRLVQKLIAK